MGFDLLSGTLNSSDVCGARSPRRARGDALARSGESRGRASASGTLSTDDLGCRWVRAILLGAGPRASGCTLPAKSAPPPTPGRSHGPSLGRGLPQTFRTRKSPRSAFASARSPGTRGRRGKCGPKIKKNTASTYQYQLNNQAQKFWTFGD